MWEYWSGGFFTFNRDASKNISFHVRFRTLRYSKPSKSAKSMSHQGQTRFAQTVSLLAHNAYFGRLRISKYPANAHEMKYFSTLFFHMEPERGGTRKPQFHCCRQSGMKFGYVTENGANSNAVTVNDDCSQEERLKNFPYCVNIKTIWEVF